MTYDYVKSVAYNEEHAIMEVTTVNGAIWNYTRVEPEEYATIISAQSLTDAVRRFVHSGKVAGVRKVFEQ